MVRWERQSVNPRDDATPESGADSGAESGAEGGPESGAEAALPGLGRLSGLLRTVAVADFPGVRLHEVASRRGLNAVPAASRVPFRWTVNPYRGCTHACT